MFRPKIVGFICDWSLPPDVRVASTGTIQGYPKMQVVRVMCVGRVDPAIVLETFAKGADGVLVIGCHPPDCHYAEGNLQTERKMKMLRKLISRTGIETDRLRLEWTYPSEVERFAEIVNSFRNRVMALGPSPLTGEKLGTDVLLNVEAAKAVAEDFRLRVLVGREMELTEKDNVYGEKVSQEEFDTVMDAAIEAEYLRNRILLLVRKGPISVVDLSRHLGVDPREVLRHIVVMRGRGLLALDRIDGEDPLYTALEAI